MRNTLNTADTMRNSKHVEIKHIYAHVIITEIRLCLSFDLARPGVATPLFLDHIESLGEFYPPSLVQLEVLQYCDTAVDWTPEMAFASDKNLWDSYD